MGPEATLTTIFEAFLDISRSDCGIEKANQAADGCSCTREFREKAREALLDLAQWIDKGGYPPEIVLDGSEYVRPPSRLYSRRTTPRSPCRARALPIKCELPI